MDTEEGVALPTKETDAIRFQHSAWVHYLNVVPSASRREMSEIENIHVKLYSPDLRTVLAEIEYPKNADLCVCNNNVTIVHPVYPK